MIINMKLLKKVYEEAKEKGNLCYINEDIPEEFITFKDFKEYFVNMIISTLQYDLNVKTDLYDLISEVDYE